MQFQHKHRLLIGVISVVAVAFALWIFNPIPLYFLNDDLIHIPLSKEGMLFQRNSLRPLGDLSVQMDYLLWVNAAGYHATNLILHVVNSLLVYVLSKKLIEKYADSKSSFWASLMIAVLFFVYAFHSETIFWILGRSGSLGTLFFIPALIFYLRRFEKGLFFLLSLFFFVGGLFAYESVWIFPIIILLISFIDRKLFSTSIRQDVVRIASVVAVFLLYLAFRYNIINEVAGNYEASAFFNADLFALAGNFVRLTARCFLPPMQSNIQFLIGLINLFVAAIILFIVCIRYQQKQFYLLLISCFLFISFLPYLSLGISTHHVEGERYLYMPSVFACMLLVAIVTNFLQNKVYQICLWIALVVYHLYFLHQAKTYYTTASIISKTTYQQIDLLKGKKRLFIDSLPQTVNGALVFRLGFDEGAQWLKAANTVDSIFILSVKQDNENWNLNYGVVNSKSITKSAFNLILVRDTMHRQTYVESKVPATQFNQQTDAYFVFKDSALHVVK